MLILIQYAWESETAFLTSFQVMSVLLVQASHSPRVGSPTRDPENKDHGVFILPGQCLGHTGLQYIYGKNGFLERT